MDSLRSMRRDEDVNDNNQPFVWNYIFFDITTTELLTSISSTISAELGDETAE